MGWVQVSIKVLTFFPMHKMTYEPCFICMGSNSSKLAKDTKLEVKKDFQIKANYAKKNYNRKAPDHTKATTKMFNHETITNKYYRH